MEPGLIFRWVTIAMMLKFTACNAISDIYQGAASAGAPCVTTKDCIVEVPECRVAVTCEQNRCVFQDQFAGVVLFEQIPGDCAVIVCSGHGETKLIPFPEDFIDDNDPCTEDRCEGTNSIHVRKTKLACYTGPRGTAGNGICKAGIQVCDEVGKPIGGCEGQVFPEVETCILPVDEDCDGLANESGVGCVCIPGQIAPCYEGPQGTAGVGRCRIGERTCASEGITQGECIGQIVPSVEVCAGGLVDEDCDGQVNEEGQDCKCGDGYVSNGEVCDDADVDPTNACTTQCELPSCGDGFLHPSLGEECDDGNLIANDTCSASCQLPICGNGVQEQGESCDDGNTLGGDACPADCVRKVVQIVFAGALLEDGRLKRWGMGDWIGPLGLGEMLVRGDEPGELGDFLPAIDLGMGKTADSIVAGAYHCCAVLTDDNLKCWGQNYYSQLGRGDTTPSVGDDPGEMGNALPVVDLGTDRTVFFAAAGVSHTCAILNGGDVKCWGQNDLGQLGVGDPFDRGRYPAHMGDNLPVVALGAGKTAIAIGLGNKHTCALLSDHTVKCWGAGGSLGLGDKSIRGRESNGMGDNLPSVDLGTGRTALALSVGFEHTCALLDDATIKCWGKNASGQLGLGDKDTRGDDPGEMGDALPPVFLGMGKTAVSLSAGGGTTCALLTDGSVKCWGLNAAGRLGLGDINARGDDPNEMGDNLPAIDFGTNNTVLAISLSQLGGCALFEGGRMKCWGFNQGGLLGVGDTDNRGDQPGEMGIALPFVAP